MSDQGQSVWPDGAREAAQAANEQGFVEHYTVDGGYNKWTDGILTALEPFVQQRINTAVGMQTNIAKSNEHSLRAEVARLRQERDHANALAESRRLAEEGARETLNEERVERSQAEQILADVDADRHRLRAEVARLQAEVARVTADRDAACRAYDLCERALRHAEGYAEIPSVAADSARLDWVLERLVTRDGKGGLLIHRYPGGVTSLLTLAGTRDADGGPLWDTLVDRAPTARAALDQARAAERPPCGDATRLEASA